MDIAAERTTILARAFLEYAAAGEADERWHTLLARVGGRTNGYFANLPIHRRHPHLWSDLRRGDAGRILRRNGDARSRRRPTSLLRFMPILTRIKPSEYHDSITLMLVAKALLELPGVEDAAVVMGTPANREIMAAAGLLTDTAAASRPDDLVIAIRAADEGAGRLRCARPTICWRRRAADGAHSAAAKIVAVGGRGRTGRQPGGHFGGGTLRGR